MKRRKRFLESVRQHLAPPPPSNDHPRLPRTRRTNVGEKDDFQKGRILGGDTCCLSIKCDRIKNIFISRNIFKRFNDFSFERAFDSSFSRSLRTKDLEMEVAYRRIRELESGVRGKNFQVEVCRFKNGDEFFERNDTWGSRRVI